MTYRPHRPALPGMGLAFAAFALVAVLFVVGGTWASNYANEHTTDCTVTSTDRTTNPEGGSDMRVYTDECGTLAVRDAWLRGQTRSADLFGKLRPGTTYRMTVAGVRFGPLSAFPMIVDAHPVAVPR